jgi:hypothetical protein
MINLTAPQAAVITALAVLSQGSQNWFQTELVLQERMKGAAMPNHKTRLKAIERVLDRLHHHVPCLVERRLGASGYSWRLTVAGKAVAETQLGVKP